MRLLLTIAAFFTILVWAGCGKNDHGDHSDHAHSEKSSRSTSSSDHDQESEETDDHSGHEHEDEEEIALGPEDMEMAEITTAKVEMGRISTSLDLSGEIGFNDARLVHITPRFAGIVKEVRYRIGEYVKAGETVAIIESNESMTSYSLKAPISGRIIEKLASAGEHVSEEESLYLLADLSTVWVNLSVYPKDADKVKQGQKATVVAVGSGNSTNGTIS